MSISVCMTTYNGERYVRQQIESILVQLGDDDELIICDDCSTDSTVEVIRRIHDPRIRLEVNARRLGHVRNFERSLSLGTKEYIFLSDQDDVWLPHKVERTIEVFRSDPSVTLVMSAAQEIDEAGNLRRSRLSSLGAARKSKAACLRQLLVRGWFYGCTLAFKRETLGSILPFPAGTFAHDIYVGLAHTLRGHIYWLDEPLIQHRLHASNLTPRKTTLAQKLGWRLLLLRQLFSLAWKFRREERLS